MQINFVVTAAAGAQRVFDLMDQEPEKDEGYVELVNAKEDAQGEMHESAERTNVWAWKHPHHDGTLTYARLEGAWSSTTWTSAMTRTSWSSTTSACGPSRGRRLPSWGPPAPARPPSPT